MLEWYWIASAIAAAYLLWTAAFEKGRDQVRWISRRFRPVEEPPPTTPAVVLGGPWYSISIVPLIERELDPTAWLTKLEVGFRGIENREAAMTVRDVVVGVRRKEIGTVFQVPAFRVPAIAPGAREEIPRVNTPHAFFEGLTEQSYKDALMLWARFTDPSGHRWEVRLDAATQRHEYQLVHERPQ